MAISQLHDHSSLGNVSNGLAGCDVIACVRVYLDVRSSQFCQFGGSFGDSSREMDFRFLVM